MIHASYIAPVPLHRPEQHPGVGKLIELCKKSTRHSIRIGASGVFGAKSAECCHKFGQGCVVLFCVVHLAKSVHYIAD